MRKILSFILILASLSFANVQKEVEKVSRLLSTDYQKQVSSLLFKKKLAIFHFKNNSVELKKYHVGETIANDFRAKLSESLIFALVEREDLNKIFKELELAQTGLVDSKTAPKVGELSGADLILTGSVAELGNEIVVDVKLIDTTTGEIKSAQNFSLPREEVLSQAKNQLWNSFQSKYGLSITGAMQMLIVPNSSFHRPFFNGGTIDVGYKLNKYFDVGLGYFSLSGIEFVREEIVQTVQSNEYHSMRNYNFKGSGPKLFVDFLWPILHWLNLGLRVEYVPLFNNIINQDISDFPVYVSTGTNNILTTKRILVKSWGTTGMSPQLLTIKFKFETLISKRISFDAHFGYTIASEYQPWVYEAGGNRQWTDEGPDGGISQNGTFLEYNNFNFSKFGVNGDDVKLNLTGWNISVGLSIHL